MTTQLVNLHCIDQFHEKPMDSLVNKKELLNYNYNTKAALVDK
jgi:hypothetical protein